MKTETRRERIERVAKRNETLSQIIPLNKRYSELAEAESILSDLHDRLQGWGCENPLAADIVVEAERVKKRGVTSDEPTKYLSDELQRLSELLQKEMDDISNKIKPLIKKLG